MPPKFDQSRYTGSSHEVQQSVTRIKFIMAILKLLMNKIFEFIAAGGISADVGIVCLNETFSLSLV
jgi:hypothetical protein